jgi:hypothetical protein
MAVYFEVVLAKVSPFKIGRFASERIKFMSYKTAIAGNVKWKLSRGLAILAQVCP